MKVYVDASVLLRWLLKAPDAINRWGGWALAVTSELTRAEARRSLDRMRVKGKLTDADVASLVRLLLAVLAQCEVIPIQRPVLERAGSPFPTALGTLDAIHLASALVWVEERGEPLTMLTHDVELALAAQASGLEVGPRGQR